MNKYHSFFDYTPFYQFIFFSYLCSRIVQDYKI